MDTKEFLLNKNLIDEETGKIKFEPETETQHFENLLEEYSSLKENDKYLRLLAEFDNYKKRVKKEKEELSLTIKSKILNAVLDLDSDLSIAKKNIENSEGLNIILGKVSNFLKTQGIEEIQTIEYDSDLHEVISIVESGESKILEVISKGYKIDGRPVRYPKVILSK